MINKAHQSTRRANRYIESGIFETSITNSIRYVPRTLCAVRINCSTGQAFHCILISEITDWADIITLNYIRVSVVKKIRSIWMAHKLLNTQVIELHKSKAHGKWYLGSIGTGGEIITPIKKGRIEIDISYIGPVKRSNPNHDALPIDLIRQRYIKSCITAIRFLNSAIIDNQPIVVFENILIKGNDLIPKFFYSLTLIWFNGETYLIVIDLWYFNSNIKVISLWYGFHLYSLEESYQHVLVVWKLMPIERCEV